MLIIQSCYLSHIRQVIYTTVSTGLALPACFYTNPQHNPGAKCLVDDGCICTAFLYGDGPIQQQQWLPWPHTTTTMAASSMTPDHCQINRSTPNPCQNKSINNAVLSVTTPLLHNWSMFVVYWIIYMIPNIFLIHECVDFLVARFSYPQKVRRIRHIFSNAFNWMKIVLSLFNFWSLSLGCN